MQHLIRASKLGVDLRLDFFSVTKAPDSVALRAACTMRPAGRPAGRRLQLQRLGSGLGAGLSSASKPSLQLSGHRVIAQGKSLAAMLARLKTSAALTQPPAAVDERRSSMACSGQGRATRSKYLQTLRNGVKSAPVARALTAHLQVRLEAEASQQALESGAVVHTVTNELELASIEYWKQGDASLAAEEKMAERQALRYNRKLLEVLQAFWEAAQRSLQSGGDVSASHLHREGHAIMLRRIYRVMIKDFDPVDCEMSIADDWRRDSKGHDSLSRKAFCDAFFELADVWTAGISALEYASFLWRLFDAVVVQIPVTSADGRVTMLSYVWKDECGVAFDDAYDVCSPSMAVPYVPTCHAHAQSRASATLQVQHCKCTTPSAQVAMLHTPCVRASAPGHMHTHTPCKRKRHAHAHAMHTPCCALAMMYASHERTYTKRWIQRVGCE